MVLSRTAKKKSKNELFDDCYREVNISTKRSENGYLGYLRGLAKML